MLISFQFIVVNQWLQSQAADPLEQGHRTAVQLRILSKTFRNHQRANASCTEEFQCRTTVSTCCLLFGIDIDRTRVDKAGIN